MMVPSKQLDFGLPARFAAYPAFGYIAAFLLLVALVASPMHGQEPATFTFGTTVVIPAGLKGDIYALPEGTDSLAALDRSKPPIGTIYTSSLQVRPQDFRIGFPGVTDRFEWFAIDYNGKFWIEKPGFYRFRLTSDDGSMLYIDGQLIIDNDGQHSPEPRRGSLRLAGGVHTIRVVYFQGSRFTISLMLDVAGPGDQSPRPFSTDEFKPPGNPEDWKFTEATQAESQDKELDRTVPARISAPPATQQPSKSKQQQQQPNDPRRRKRR
jgi:hypothetical protein